MKKTLHELALEAVCPLTLSITGDRDQAKYDAFIQGFEVAQAMFAEAWEDGYEAGKLAGVQTRPVGEDA